MILIPFLCILLLIFNFSNTNSKDLRQEIAASSSFDVFLDVLDEINESIQMETTGQMRNQEKLTFNIRINIIPSKLSDASKIEFTTSAIDEMTCSEFRFELYHLNSLGDEVQLCLENHFSKNNFCILQLDESLISNQSQYIIIKAILICLSEKCRGKVYFSTSPNKSPRLNQIHSEFFTLRSPVTRIQIPWRKQLDAGQTELHYIIESNIFNLIPLNESTRICYELDAYHQVISIYLICLERVLETKSGSDTFDFALINFAEFYSVQLLGVSEHNRLNATIPAQIFSGQYQLFTISSAKDCQISIAGQTIQLDTQISYYSPLIISNIEEITLTCSTNALILVNMNRLQERLANIMVPSIDSPIIMRIAHEYWEQGADDCYQLYASKNATVYLLIIDTTRIPIQKIEESIKQPSDLEQFDKNAVEIKMNRVELETEICIELKPNQNSFQTIILIFYEGYDAAVINTLKQKRVKYAKGSSKVPNNFGLVILDRFQDSITLNTKGAILAKIQVSDFGSILQDQNQQNEDQILEISSTSLEYRPFNKIIKKGESVLFEINNQVDSITLQLQTSIKIDGMTSTLRQKEYESGSFIRVHVFLQYPLNEMGCLDVNLKDQFSSLQFVSDKTIQSYQCAKIENYKLESNKELVLQFIYELDSIYNNIILFFPLQLNNPSLWVPAGKSDGRNGMFVSKEQLQLLKSVGIILIFNESYQQVKISLKQNFKQLNRFIFPFIRMNSVSIDLSEVEFPVQPYDLETFRSATQLMIDTNHIKVFQVDSINSDVATQIGLKNGSYRIENSVSQDKNRNPELEKYFLNIDLCCTSKETVIIVNFGYVFLKYEEPMLIENLMMKASERMKALPRFYCQDEVILRSKSSLATVGLAEEELFFSRIDSFEEVRELNFLSIEELNTRVEFKYKRSFKFVLIGHTPCFILKDFQPPNKPKNYIHSIKIDQTKIYQAIEFRDYFQTITITFVLGSKYIVSIEQSKENELDYEIGSGYSRRQKLLPTEQYIIQTKLVLETNDTINYVQYWEMKISFTHVIVEEINVHSNELFQLNLNVFSIFHLKVDTKYNYTIQILPEESPDEQANKNQRSRVQIPTLHQHIYSYNFRNFKTISNCIPINEIEANSAPTEEIHIQQPYEIEFSEFLIIIPPTDIKLRLKADFDINRRIVGKNSTLIPLDRFRFSSFIFEQFEGNEQKEMKEEQQLISNRFIRAPIGLSRMYLLPCESITYFLGQQRQSRALFYPPFYNKFDSLIYISPNMEININRSELKEISDSNEIDFSKKQCLWVEEVPNGVLLSNLKIERRNDLMKPFLVLNQISELLFERNGQTDMYLIRHIDASLREKALHIVFVFDRFSSINKESESGIVLRGIQEDNKYFSVQIVAESSCFQVNLRRSPFFEIFGKSDLMILGFRYFLTDQVSVSCISEHVKYLFDSRFMGYFLQLESENSFILIESKKESLNSQIVWKSQDKVAILGDPMMVEIEEVIIENNPTNVFGFLINGQIYPYSATVYQINRDQNPIIVSVNEHMNQNRIIWKILADNRILVQVKQNDIEIISPSKLDFETENQFEDAHIILVQNNTKGNFYLNPKQLLPLVNNL